MFVFVVIGIFGYLAGEGEVAANPILSISCGPKNERSSNISSPRNIVQTSDEEYVDSICNNVYKVVVPKFVKNGQIFYTHKDLDMSPEYDTLDPVFETAPRRLLDTLSGKNDFDRYILPLKTPKLKIPKLRKHTNIGNVRAPKIGDSMIFPKFPKLRGEQELSNTEKIERFKKGIETMLHVVKVIGHVDEYFSERARFIIEKLYKVFILE